MNSKNQKTTPAIIAGLALASVLTFALGRSTAPKIPTNTRTDAAETASQEGAGEATDTEGSEEKTIVFTPEALKEAGVKVAPVALRPQTSGLPFNGTIEAAPDNVARVASVVSGRVTRLYASLGVAVQQGQTLALVESRSVGEAQAAYGGAVARLQNARSSYNVVLKQARAGVFSRGPVEIAQRAQTEAAADVRAGETAVNQARAALDNANRLARAGSFARPALEAAQSQYAAAQQSYQTAQATQTNAAAAVRAAQAELRRRRQIARGGGYSSRPVQEARRVLAAAQSARATAQSEVATTRADLSRSKSLAIEGLISTRDLEVAQNAFDTASARLDTAQADEKTAAQELERQQKLAASDVAGTAEVQEAQARLAAAEADARTRRAEATRAQDGLRLAGLALARERAVFDGNIANRREIGTARASLESAKNALEKARQTFAVNNAALQRENRIFRQNLNNTAQVQTARSNLTAAQAEVSAAQTALQLLKSAPGGSATVPIRAPLSGVVQARDVAQGEVIEADKDLFTIVDLRTVRVAMFLPETDMARVRVGFPVSVQIDALPNQNFAGRIELISSEVDPKNRTIEAQAVLSNAGEIRPGMFARGTIATGSSTLAVTVATDAVQDVKGQPTVFVSGEKAGEFEARPVETGVVAGGQTQIKSGLKPGEKIAVEGAFMVKAQAMKSELGEEE